MDRGLKIQNRAYGQLDLPFVSDFILEHQNVRRVLDIGTGEGSFILEIAKKTPLVNYIAIDGNVDPFIPIAHVSAQKPITSRQGIPKLIPGANLKKMTWDGSCPL